MSNCAVRFLDNNLAVPDTARITYSSQVTQFPASNAYNPRRSKVWKPGGNFTITTSNQQLHFRDGADKTATITAGNYTYSTLATAIAAAMNAVSSNWTCVYTVGTRKFTIQRSSGASALRTNVGTNAIWGSIGFYSTSVVQVASSYPSDFGVNHTDEWYKADFVTAAQVQAMMAIWPMGAACPWSGDADIRFQLNNIDQWDSPAVEIDLTRYDRILPSFLDELEDNTYRFARLWWSDPRNPCGPEGFAIGHIYFGGYRTVTISNVAPGIQKKLVDLSRTQKAVAGNDYVREGLSYRTFSNMDMQLLDAAERRALEQMILQLNTKNPLYFSLDPLGEVTADLDESTFYAKFDREPELKHVIRDRYTLSFDLRELI